jgi:hypothetical protein
MQINQEQIATIFNHWANRYAANPNEFGDILGDNGERCSFYFLELAEELGFKVEK